MPGWFEILTRLRLNCWLLLSSRDPDGGLLDRPVGVVRRFVSIRITRWGKIFLDPIGVLIPGTFVARAWHLENLLLWIDLIFWNRRYFWDIFIHDIKPLNIHIYLITFMPFLPTPRVGFNHSCNEGLLTPVGVKRSSYTTWNFFKFFYSRPGTCTWVDFSRLPRAPSDSFLPLWGWWGGLGPEKIDFCKNLSV